MPRRSFSTPSQWPRTPSRLVTGRIVILDGAPRSGKNSIARAYGVDVVTDWGDKVAAQRILMEAIDRARKVKATA
jgi:thymidine phosphorylase